MTNLTPWPTQQKVKDLAADAGPVLPLLEAMVKVSEKLSESQRLYPQADHRGGREGHRSVSKGVSHRLATDACKKIGTNVTQKAGWPEESDRPVYSEVAKMITVLMGSFPTAKIPEPEIFVRVLMDDVMALDPSFVEMESTCRELRKTNKFMPSISEVIEELEKQQELWDRRRTWSGFLRNGTKTSAKKSPAQKPR